MWQAIRCKIVPQASTSKYGRQLGKSPSRETILFINKKILDEQWSPEQISNMIDRYRIERTNYIKEQKKINGDVNGKLFKFRLNDLEIRFIWKYFTQKLIV